MRLIDADALVARFSLWLEDDNYADGNTYADIAEDFIIPSINEAETIEELLPSAEVEPVKHGKWIGHNISEDPKFIESIDKDTCSECGQTFYQIAETGCLWKYCPNCGARMGEEE